MAECECLSKCPFFNDRMANMPAAASMIKTRLCLGDNAGCARFMVMKKLGRDKVPTDLSPSNLALGRQLAGA